MHYYTQIEYLRVEFDCHSNQKRPFVGGGGSEFSGYFLCYSPSYNFASSETPICSWLCCSHFWESLFAILGWAFTILFEIILIEIQEEIHHFAGWDGGGLRGTKIVKKHFVNKLAFSNQKHKQIVWELVVRSPSHEDWEVLSSCLTQPCQLHKIVLYEFFSKCTRKLHTTNCYGNWLLNQFRCNC